GWGHSPADYAIDVAIAAGVSRLYLFHHDPLHDDDAVKQLEDTQRARASAAGSKIEIFAAAEGMSFDVAGKGRGKTILDLSALERRPIIGGRVMMITPHDADVLALEQALPEDGLVLTASPDGQKALETAAAAAPDLIIINSKLDDGDGASFI